jgi:hypothetical protein
VIFGVRRISTLRARGLAMNTLLSIMADRRLGSSGLATSTSATTKDGVSDYHT